VHTKIVEWEVDLHDDFVPEFHELHKDGRTNCWPISSFSNNSARNWDRPRADTLNGSRHANMKELRFDAADGVWRFAFAFDPKRRAIVLCGGDKSGGGEKRFYRQLIDKAD
jgi:hypothetical protein